MTGTKIHTTHENALILIAGGANHLSVTSDFAPFGYRLDLTPAGKRGRKAGSKLKEGKVKLKGKRGRKATGPVVAAINAPYGLTKTGAIAKKRGRKSKAEKALLASMPATIPVKATSVPSVNMAASTEELAIAPEIIEEEDLTPDVMADNFIKGMKVRLIRSAVPKGYGRMVGIVKNIPKDSNSIFVSWKDGSGDFRARNILSVVP